MISCILAFYIAASAPPALAGAGLARSFTAQAAPQHDDPDALYARREDLESARRAERIWQSRLTANPQDFESAWKLARARYWIGGHAAAAEGRAILESGIAAGKAAASLRLDRPEGHFWMAASMGALAESFGLRQGIKYRGAIKDALLTVLKLDPAFLDGSADRALGRWYFKVPGLFGGSKSKSEAHLRQSLTYDPDSIASHVFLAETLLDMNRRADAAAELRKAIAAPIDAEWEPEDREFKQRAEALLARSVQ